MSGLGNASWQMHSFAEEGCLLGSILLGCTFCSSNACLVEKLLGPASQLVLVVLRRVVRAITPPNTSGVSHAGTRRAGLDLDHAVPLLRRPHGTARLAHLAALAHQRLRALSTASCCCRASSAQSAQCRRQADAQTWGVMTASRATAPRQAQSRTMAVAGPGCALCHGTVCGCGTLWWLCFVSLRPYRSSASAVYITCTCVWFDLLRLVSYSARETLGPLQLSAALQCAHRSS